MHVALIVAALQAATPSPPARDSLPPEPDSAQMATAYADAGTRELVRLARGHRGVIDASVFRYTATTRQRVSVSVRAFRRDRLLYRREAAGTIDWRRDAPSRVVVEGAREVIPVAVRGVQVPEDLDSWARGFVPEPGDDRLFVSPTGGGFSWHPLVENGESLYRYAAGDTTAIRLPDGTRIRLVELRVTPRVRDIRVITGSFWIEMDDYAIVQAVFRPARDFDLERDLPTISEEDADDADDVPAFLKPIRFEARYITVEYGLWEMRWWMPRLLAFEGHVQMGPGRFPVTVEVSYDDYAVEADRYGLPELPPVIRELAGAPYITPRPYSYSIGVEVRDTADLLASPLLPGSVYEGGEALMTDAQMRELADRLDALPPLPWAVGRPRVSWPWVPGNGLARYNRVEGLSAGVGVDWDLARARVDLTARLGVADREPRAELGVEVPTLRRRWRLAGYHRLAVADVASRPLALGNSLNALLFGRDDGTYFGASGAELRVEPDGGGWYTVRVFAERQRAVDRNTDFSLAHLADDGRRFRPGLDADAADQAGLDANVHFSRGLDPTGFRWGGSLGVAAETGSYTFARPGAVLRSAVPLPGGLMAGVEVGGGTTLGSGTEEDPASPAQSRWFLGGPATVRGFHGAWATGPDYARARVELTSDYPAVRVAAFSDAGWAGSFDAYSEDDVLVSVGAGVSFLDGLLRADLARTLQPVEQWRLEVYIDALF